MKPTILSLQELVPRFSSYPFGSIRTTLEMELTPFEKSDFTQLDYIERHLKNHSKGCQSMIVEKHYIDRGFMDDYVTFYASSLKPYPNWCRRIHFFSLEENDLKDKVEALFELGKENPLDSDRQKKEKRKEFFSACESFSEDYYLGFCVIKPLNGSPVGRTVLRHYDEQANDGLRKFNCTRPYKVHLFGLELTVCGLVFQQQDQAVSACATTALWTSLSKTKDFEDIRTPTPAEITKRATQYFLSSGRAIPQVEGLSHHEMSQAIQSLGLSPYVIKVNRPLDTKAYLYSAILSGFAPVLLISDSESGHAVTVSGMKIKSQHKPNILKVSHPNGDTDSFDDMSGDLLEIYVNDDRHSPYFKVKVNLDPADKDFRLSFVYLKDDGSVEYEKEWILKFILIPMHGKIRLSFAEIRQMAYSLINSVNAYRSAYATINNIKLDNNIQLRTGIMKHSAYVQNLFFGKNKIGIDKWREFNEKIFLSRYVGVVNLMDEKSFGSLDILIDTTNIKRNPHYLALICRTTDEHISNNIVEPLAELLQCPFVINNKVT